MKVLFVVLVLMLMSLSAFAQRNPYPYPTQCQVVAVDRYHRVLARFYSRTDGRGQCRDGLRQCNYEVRRRGWRDVRCAQLRNRW